MRCRWFPGCNTAPRRRHTRPNRRRRLHPPVPAERGAVPSGPCWFRTGPPASSALPAVSALVFACFPAGVPFLEVAPGSEEIRPVPRHRAQGDRSVTFGKPPRKLIAQVRLSNADLGGVFALPALELSGQFDDRRRVEGIFDEIFDGGN